MSYIALGGEINASAGFRRTNGVLVSWFNGETFEPMIRFADGFLFWLYEREKVTPDLRLAVVFYEGLINSVELHTNCVLTISEARRKFGASKHPRMDLTGLKYHHRHFYERLPGLDHMLM
jgi:hypothetical protein